MNIDKPLTMPRLRVVDFNSQYLTPEIQDWKDSNAIPYAASCSRQIWFGDVDQFHDFPVKEGTSVPIKFLRSDKAYEALLAILSGYESKRIGEQHIRGQFSKGWKIFVRDFPIESKFMQSLVGCIRADAKFIHNNISSGFKESCISQIAKDISGQKKGEKILIVADKNRHGDISELTERIIRVSENFQKHYNGFIHIVPPSDNEMSGIAADLEHMKISNKIRTRLTLHKFSAIESIIPEVSRVYIATAMGHSVLNDRRLIKCWQDQQDKSDRTFVHLRGEPQRRGESNELWLNAGLDSDSYISPEDLMAERTKRNINNKDVIKRAKDAFKVCAQLRDKGRLPSRVIPIEYPELVSSLES